MNQYLMIYVLFLHWIADFILQSDYIALNKSKSNIVLTFHVAVYTLAMALGLYFYGIEDGSICGIVLANFVLHWITDYVTSRINAKLYANYRHWFFVNIGFDQFIHTATLILLVNFFT